MHEWTPTASDLSYHQNVISNLIEPDRRSKFLDQVEQILARDGLKPAMINFVNATTAMVRNAAVSGVSDDQAMIIGSAVLAGLQTAVNEIMTGTNQSS